MKFQQKSRKGDLGDSGVVLGGNSSGNYLSTGENALSSYKRRILMLFIKNGVNIEIIIVKE